ncbi:sulfite exporter TauE/SafE family protein [Shimia biformata]|uniref:sulfite exporter TauE/SafE family protein n=1 Tax=Shimia biformata TaxID=1294299 RepID=UPI00194EBC6D|nr:sulfite exporter TauE/SafE family protein [Shimia biformata]
MLTFFPELAPQLILLSCLVAVLAGVIKGMVGFAMPMVLISGLGSFLSPELALAGLILPTLVTNGMQALRQGTKAALASVRRFRVFLLAGLVTLVISAQFVRVLPVEVMLLMIGVPVALFSVAQLFGLHLSLARPSFRAEAMIGGFAGLIGGISGVWGPPTVAYLTAINTEKRDQMRVQGVIYGLGAVALAGAHLGSGVLRAETAPFSALLVIPAVCGMWIGTRIQDRIDQAQFRRATLLVLTIAALNLVRRAVFG